MQSQAGDKTLQLVSLVLHPVFVLCGFNTVHQGSTPAHEYEQDP